MCWWSLRFPEESPSASCSPLSRTPHCRGLWFAGFARGSLSALDTATVHGPPPTPVGSRLSRESRKQKSVTHTSSINSDLPPFVTDVHGYILSCAGYCTLWLVHFPALIHQASCFLLVFSFCQIQLYVSVCSLTLALGFYLFTNSPRWQSKHLPCLWMVGAQLSKIQPT